MWKLYEAVNNKVTDFLTTIVSNESSQSIRLNRFKGLYEDALQIINEMRECNDIERESWIKKTSVKQDLNQMVDLLVEEEKEHKQLTRNTTDEVDETGMCMDYILKQHIIDTLCGIAMVDDPAGSTEMITSQLTRLYGEVKYPILSSNNNHITISGLIQKLMQMYFNKTISPELEKTIILFVEIICEKICDDPILINAFFMKSDTVLFSSPSPSPSPSPNAIQASFPLVEPLIPHINDSSSLGRTSRQVLLLLAAFPLSDITVYLTYNTPIVKLLTQNLLDAILQLNSSSANSTQLESPENILFQRLQFISQLLMLCKSSADCKDRPERALELREAILKSVQDEILHGYFEVELLNIRNTRIISSTRILRLMLSQLLVSPSSPIIDFIVLFLCGETSHQSILYETLLSRINNNYNLVSITTMQLFDVMLKSQHPAVMTRMLPHLLECSIPTNISRFNQFSDGFDKALPNGKQLCRGEFHGSVGKCEQDVEFVSAAVQRCRDIKIDYEVSDISAESPFLSVLLTRLRMFFRQTLEVNLEVSQLISTVAIVASPVVLQKLFLSKDGDLSFLSELNNLWSTAVTRSEEVPNFSKYLKMTESSLNFCDHTIGIQREDRLSVDCTFSQFIEAFVVLREFLIELGCIIIMRDTSAFTI